MLLRPQQYDNVQPLLRMAQDSVQQCYDFHSHHRQAI